VLREEEIRAKVRERRAKAKVPACQPVWRAALTRSMVPTFAMDLISEIAHIQWHQVMLAREAYTSAVSQAVEGTIRSTAALALDS
jgi:hypothetical protein